MDIYEFAIQMERDGRQFYLELASKTQNKGVKNIFNMLADDEDKHQKTIEKIRIGNHEMVDTPILENAKNVFEQMKQFNDEFDLSGDEEDLYRQAMEAEQKSISFYQDRADQEKDPACQTLFTKLAGEEKKHYHLLSNLVDFVNRPKIWLENAEFTHLEEY